MSVERMAPEGRAIRGGRPMSWRTARRSIDLRDPVLMGILNITPDSFSDGGRFLGEEEAARRLEVLVEEGADVIDIGGESTRPGAEPVDEEEELRRVLPTLRRAVELDVPISIDTTKTGVARAALDAGADIINDISGLRFEPGLAELAAEQGAGLVLMHIRGEPRTMQKDIRYEDLLGDVESELRESLRTALDAGCRPDSLVVDPGIGFGKTAEGNLDLIVGVDRLARLGYPVMIGPSRKSFIGHTLQLPLELRLEPTLAACVVGLMRGARIFRVHDVAEARRALDMADLLMKRL